MRNMSISDFTRCFDGDVWFRLGIEIDGETVEYDCDADHLAWEDEIDLNEGTGEPEDIIELDDLLVKKAYVNKSSNFDVYIDCELRY